MYICICNAVTDRHIRDAVGEGYDSLTSLRSHLGVGDGCGRCESCAQDLVSSLGASPIQLSKAAETAPEART